MQKFLHAQMVFSGNWITGAGKSFVVSFNPTPTVRIFDSNYTYYFSKGSSCISNENSRLQLLCNGYQIYDSNGVHLLNGDSLVPAKIYDRYNGFSVYNQTSIILPFALGVYYCITPTVSNQEYQNSWGLGGLGNFDLLLYHKINLNSGPNGAVIKKAIPIIQGQSIGRPQMMACRHADGVNWWLLKPYRGNNSIHKFLFTQDSVYDVGLQSFSIPIMSMNDLSGQIDFDLEGKRYASVVQGSDELFLCDFDRCSGALTNPRTYKIPDSARTPTNSTLDTEPSGLCWSPDGRFIYVSKYWNIFQLDLQDPDTLTRWHHVVNLDTSEQMFMGYGNMFRANDLKIYIGNWNNTSAGMSLIANPNLKGAGCNFCARCLQFPKTGASHPPCMPNYSLGKDTTVICWPMNLIESEESAAAESCVVYPNPAQTHLTVESDAFKKGLNRLRIFNLMGQCVLEEAFKTVSGKHTVSVQGLPSGVYILKVNNMVRRVVIE
jgi:hypothetical protein